MCHSALRCAVACNRRRARRQPGGSAGEYRLFAAAAGMHIRPFSSSMQLYPAAQRLHLCKLSSSSRLEAYSLN